MIDVISDIQEHVDIDEAVSIQDTGWKKCSWSTDAYFNVCLGGWKLFKKSQAGWFCCQRRPYYRNGPQDLANDAGEAEMLEYMQIHAWTLWTGKSVYTTTPPY
jgi:hypothetical protein